MKKFVMIIVALIIVTGVFSIYFKIYNSLVVADKNVSEARSGVEVVCQRRLDLIPNLVEAVKGYAAHEKETLEAVTAARSRAMEALKNYSGSAEPDSEKTSALIASQKELTNRAMAIFALSEKYPDLKANANFMAFQDQMEGTENRIAIERQRYNAAVKDYNTLIDIYPEMIVARIAGFKEKNFFEAESEAVKTVNVKFQ